MEQASFYGGLPGYSFFIAACYNNEEDMDHDFLENPNCPVHYGEYVLITAETEPVNPANYQGRNSIQNGRIYYRDSNGRAVYKGTIIGPTGLAPDLLFESYSEVETRIADQVELDPTFDRYSTSDAHIVELVPGREDDGNGGYKYNNEIKWAEISYSSPEHEISTAYIGFKVPYSTFDFDVEDKEYYNNAKPEITEITNSYPFFNEFKIKIPEGVPGTKIETIAAIDISQNAGDTNYVGNLFNNPTSIPTNYTKIIGYKLRKFSRTDPDDLGTVDAKYTYCGFVDGIKQVTVATGATDRQGHLLIQHYDTAKNPAAYKMPGDTRDTYWHDLGIINNYVIERVHSNVTNLDPATAVGANQASVKNYLNSTAPYANGLPSPFEGAMVLHENSAHELDAYAYNYASNTWEYLSEYGKNSGGGANSYTLKDFQTLVGNISSNGIVVSEIVPSINGTRTAYRLEPDPNDPTETIKVQYEADSYDSLYMEYTIFVPNEELAKSNIRLSDKNYSISVSTNLPSEQVYVKEITDVDSANNPLNGIRITLRIPFAEELPTETKLFNIHTKLDTVHIVAVLMSDPV